MSITNGPFDNHNLYRSLSGVAIVETSKNKKRLLNVSDSIMSLFVVAPLVVAHWRGTWDGMDQYERIFPSINCMIFGAILHCSFAILREPLHSKFNKLKAQKTKKSFQKSFQVFVIKRLYTYFFSLGCIMHW